ncbi:MAG: hypothetical protein IJS61_08655 [Firmicutes bacterium]|nr:hypothetical protein [Bacillota bacterium]
MKDIIKENNSSKAVKKNTENVNKEQVESSQSKAVKGKEDVLKVVEEKATFRDYSGRIRYGTNEAKEETSPTKGFEKVKKARIKEKQREIVKSGNDKGVVREHNSTDIVKPESNEGIVKPQYFEGIRTETKSEVKSRWKRVKNGIIKESSRVDVVRPELKSDVIRDKSISVVKAENKGSVIKDNSFLQENKNENKPQQSNNIYNKKVKEKLKNRQQRNISSKNENATVIERTYADSIISNKHDYAVTASFGEYANTKPEEPTEHKSRYEQAIHRTQLEKAKANINKSADTADIVTYRDDTEENKLDTNKQAVIEHKVETVNSRENIVNTSENTPSTEEKTWSKYGQVVKDKLRDKAKKDKHSKDTVAPNSKTASTLIKQSAANTVHSTLQETDDEGIKATDKAVTAVATATDILKSESVENARRLHRQGSKKAIDSSTLGIKEEFKANVKTVISDTNASVHKMINTVGKSAVNGIKDGISENAEDDLSFRAVDDVIKGVEGVKRAKEIYKADRNSVNKAIEGVNSTTKAIKNAPTTIKNTVTGVKTTSQKFNAFRRLQNRRKAEIIRAKAAKNTKKIAGLLMKSAKSAALKFMAIIMSFVIVTVTICGAVVAAIGGFIWNTSSLLDTTQIIKYLSELDYNRQNAWFGKGKTAVDIAKQNYGKDTTYKYVYALAVDVEPDVAKIDDLDVENINCLVKVGEDSDGDNIRPTQKGFTHFYYSADEMLENYRWTTDDYRAALAYMQVKDDNLGWIESHIGFVGKDKLKKACKSLHNATYTQNIVIENYDGKSDTSKYTLESGIYTASFGKNNVSNKYFFGRKFSVKYLIDHNMIKFSNDEEKNEEMRKQFYYTYSYGNYELANLQFPLELKDGEKISDRISKHFGAQLVLSYEPPEPNEKKVVFGKINKSKSYHYAIDLSAEEGDVIYAPIGGLCKATQREGRGFEYVISTAYSGTDFDFTKDGYVCKISCSSASYVGTQVVTAGTPLGLVGGDMGVNYYAPSIDNDTESEDLSASAVFPCYTDTTFHTIDGDFFEEHPEASRPHIHIELYKTPCDFTKITDLDANILAPELFFDYSSEEDTDE